MLQRAEEEYNKGVDKPPQYTYIGILNSMPNSK